MFQRILCPIDFTSYSHRALGVGAEMARAYGGAITGLHVLPPTPALGEEGDKCHPQRWTATDLTRMQAHVLKVLQEVEAPSPTAIVVSGDPGPEIVKVAMTLPASQIVMASQGHTGVARCTCGSVTRHVLGHSPVPVVTVRYPGERRASTRGPFRRILCAIDFSPVSLKALQYAAGLAEKNDAQLIVAHALPPDFVLRAAPVGSTPNQSNDVRVVWRRRLREAAAEQVPSSTNVQEHLLIGDPSTAILHLADREHCDLIVVGGHYGTPPGSVLNALVTRSPCPVIVTRSPRASGHPVVLSSRRNGDKALEEDE